MTKSKEGAAAQYVTAVRAFRRSSYGATVPELTRINTGGKTHLGLLDSAQPGDLRREKGRTKVYASVTPQGKHFSGQPKSGEIVFRWIGGRVVPIRVK